QPSEPFHHELRGRALSAMGQLENAVAALREAVRLRRNWPTAMARLAVLESATNEPQAGLRHCRETLRATGSLLYARLRLTAYLAFFQALDLAHSPLSSRRARRARVRQRVGRCLEKRGDIVRALTQYYRALVLSPDEGDLLTDIGRVLLEQEKPLEA